MIKGKKVALFSDFNIDCNIDETLSSNPIHRMESLYALNQLVTKPTRDSSKCIDLILRSVPEKHKLCDVAEVAAALSDHYMIFTTDFNIKIKKHKTIKFRDDKIFDSDLFVKDIEWLLPK